MTKTTPKKPPRAPATLEHDDVLEDDYIPPDLEFFEKRDELRGEGGGSINVYREGPGGYRDLTFVRSFGLDEFEPGMLQQSPFNGGRFRIHMRGATGIKDNFLFKVEPLAGATPAALPGAPAVTVHPAATDVASLIAAMQSGFKELGTLIVTARAPAAGQSIGMRDLIEFAKALAPQGAPGGLGAAGMFSQLGEAIELLDRLREGGDGDRGSILGALGRSLDKIAGPVGEVVARIAEKNLSAAAGAPPALAAPGTVSTEPLDMEALLKQYAGVVIAAAKADKDPAPFAQLALDYGDEAQIAEFIKAPNWFEIVAGAIPDALAHRQWFEEFHEVLLKALTPEPGGEKIAETTPAPAADAQPPKV